MGQGFTRRGCSGAASWWPTAAADRAALPNCLRWGDLPWGLAIHLGRRTVDLQFVVKPVKFPQIQTYHRCNLQT